jgi:hypothetical protein
MKQTRARSVSHMIQQLRLSAYEVSGEIRTTGIRRKERHAFRADRFRYLFNIVELVSSLYRP